MVVKENSVKKNNNDFTENLNQGQNVNDNTTMFFIFEEAKETILDFLQGIMKVL